MKKALIPVILMISMLAACGEKEEEVEESQERVREEKVAEPTPAEEPEEPEEPGNPGDPAVTAVTGSEVSCIPLRLDTHRNVVYDKDIEYKTRFEGSYDEIILDGDDYYGLRYSLSELNDNMKQSVEEASEDYMDYAYEDNGFDDDWGYYYFRECSTTVDRADTKVVCLSLLWGDYAGGVHPNSYYEAMVYDTQSGKKLKLDDIIDSSKESELLKLVGERALDENPGLEDMLFDDLDKALQDLADKDQLTFDLDRDGLIFYFSPYEIAAYAAGSTVVKIGYDEIPGLVKDEYRQLPADYIVTYKDLSDVHSFSDGREISFNVEYDEEDTMTIHIMVDGKDTTFEDYGYDNWFYLAENDGNKYIFRETQHDNDYREVTVYEMNGSRPVESSTVWAYFADTPMNPDCINMGSRGDLLSTYEMVNTYRLEDTGAITPINDYYLIKSWSGEWELTLKQDMEVEARDSFDTDDVYTMPMSKGEKLTFYSTDNETYVDFKTANGSFVRIYVDTDDYPQSVNGIDIDELFDGIMFAG